MFLTDRSMIMRLFYSLLFCGTLSSTHGQFGLTQNQLITDFEVFKHSISDIHPGLYWYADSLEISRRFDAIENELAKSLELNEFYALLQGFYANLGCGHSWMSIPYKWRKYLDDDPYQMPFKLFFEQNKVIISEDLTDKNILGEGAQLVRINGEDPIEVMDQLSHYAPSDGYNETHRRPIIAGNFSRYYQTLIHTDSIFNLEIKLGDEITSLIVKGITYEKFKSLKKERYPPKESGPLLSFKIEEGIGFLNIQTFESSWIKSQGQKYQNFLKESFTKIREEKIDKLVLDLRGNGGGDDDYGVLLCQYLINQQFRYFDRMESITKSFDYKTYSNSRWLNLLGTMFLRKDEKKPGTFTYNKAKGLKPQQPKAEVFGGDLVVLVDGGTFSTAADVASILHANEKGCFIGEEVGGGYYGNNSAIMYDIRLPNSGITYYIPVIRYYSSVNDEYLFGKGVEPNILMLPTYDIYKSKIDESMEAAKQYFNRRDK